MIAKTIMFLSSYSPVFILLAFQVKDLPAKWVFGALAVVGLAGIATLLSWTRQKAATTFVIVSRRDAGAEVAGFLAGYLLPLITLNKSGADFYWASGTFLALALIVAVGSSMVQVNPLLYLMRYKVLAVDTEAEHGTRLRMSRYLITRRDVRIGEVIDAHRLAADVLLRAKG
ncbi:hypothetical protein [Salinibacterium sp. ZJ450]|uniref:hypothetical protein n=1 Tax=Salinibacterium sp. ZJ450 TaxID=2708338 RepID=UPI00141E00EF|nr:hypothetical protein [Salinibacterium sp. ZJ450]